MNNGQINQRFLEVTDNATRNAVLEAIAKHYGISLEEVIDEIVHDEAESILDYLTGSTRIAASLIMQRHRLAA